MCSMNFERSTMWRSYKLKNLTRRFLSLRDWSQVLRTRHRTALRQAERSRLLHEDGWFRPRELGGRRSGGGHNQYRREKPAVQLPSALCPLPLGGRSQRHNGTGGRNLERRKRRLPKNGRHGSKALQHRRAFAFGSALIGDKLQ